VIKNIFFIILFSLLLNWCIGLQILVQTQKQKSTRIIAIVMSILTGVALGILAIQ
jgi:hypothetical protein